MKTLSILLLLLLNITSSFAQQFTISGQNIVRSGYAGFDDGALVFDGLVIQGNVTFSSESGLFIDVWYSQDTENSQASWGDEVDYTIGWNGKLSENISLSVSLSYFDNHLLGQVPFNDLIKSGFKVSWENISSSSRFELTPFVAYSNFFVPDKETTFDGGNVYSIGVDSQIHVNEKISLASSTSFVWNDGAFKTSPGPMFKHTSSLNYKKDEKITWHIIETSFYVPFAGRHSVEQQTVLGTGFSWKF